MLEFVTEILNTEPLEIVAKMVNIENTLDVYYESIGLDFVGELTGNEKDGD